MERKKTAVLISGQHLQAEGWDEVMWGDPSVGREGRIARGLIEALRWDAEMIGFGTGASERDGKKEADIIYEYAQEHISTLPAFSDLEDPSGWLAERAVIDRVTQNTREEVKAAAEIAISRGIERIVLVSSPTHIFRAHQSALSLFSSDERFGNLAHELYAVSSDVPYAGATVDDVVIIEPPHRGDLPRILFHTNAKRIFQFLKDADVARGFNDAWGILIDEWKKKLL